MVQRGEADVAAIDCVTFALLQRNRPSAVEQLRVLTRTSCAPGVPFVTRADVRDELVSLLRAALTEALEAPELKQAHECLMLGGLDALPLSDYEGILAIEQQAAMQGFALLR